MSLAASSSRRPMSPPHKARRRASSLAWLVSWMASAWIVGGAAGCMGTEVGNPQDDAVVSVRFQGLLSGPGPQTLPSGLVIEEAWLTIGQLELWSGVASAPGRSPAPTPAPSRCDGPKTTLMQAHTFAELVSAQALPGPIEDRAQATQYCLVKLKLALPQPNEALPAGVPSALRDYTVFVRGKRPDGVAFEVRVRDTSLLWLGAMTGESFALDGPERALLMTFALEEWLDVEALNAQTPSAQGLVVLDSDGPRSVLVRELMRRLRTSARLHRDDNADGLLQPGEAALARGLDQAP